MKLKLDCVRSVLEELESFPIGAHTLSALTKSIETYGEDAVLYTACKLTEANYINAKYGRSASGRPLFHCLFDLTFEGHEFLNSIRTPGIWERLKGAAGENGTVCLKAVAEVGAELLVEVIRKRIGI